MFWCPQGIVRAIKDYQGPLKEHEVAIFVRRGGPNYQEGLRVMGEVGEENGIRYVELRKMFFLQLDGHAVPVSTTTIDYTAF